MENELGSLVDPWIAMGVIGGLVGSVSALLVYTEKRRFNKFAESFNEQFQDDPIKTHRRAKHFRHTMAYSVGYGERIEEVITNVQRRIYNQQISQDFDGDFKDFQAILNDFDSYIAYKDNYVSRP